VISSRCSLVEREEVAMSEPGARRPDVKGTTLERQRSEVLDAARPLPPDEDVLIGGLTDEEDRLFLAAILDA
jgi:hypothetical protein